MSDFDWAAAMPSRVIVVGLLVGVCAALVAGCAVDASGGDPVTPPPTENEVKGESLLDGVVSGTQQVVSGTGQVVGICSPLTCCFPSGAEWQDNAFENSLKALGCTMPAAYTESYTSSMWWLYTRCPASAKLSALVSSYATVSPYYAKTVVNACLLTTAVANLQLNSVFVEFDPTCSSCRKM